MKLRGFVTMLLIMMSIKLTVIKVESHRLDLQKIVPAGTLECIDFLGNHAADKLAEHHAASAQIPEADFYRIRRIEKQEEAIAFFIELPPVLGICIKTALPGKYIIIVPHTYNWAIFL